ncbi:MAG: sel1 repeat family protein [Clostridia bacterium]|nr:sel1 repeat family protein [Clostridia bacterium]
MTEETLKERLKRIVKNTTTDESPQICSLLRWEIDRDFEYLRGSAMEYVYNFERLDPAAPFAPLVAEFIEEVLTEEMENGNADAACDLGSFYYTGRIGEQNFAMAVELYKRAADMGSRQANENLGYCYYYGRDIPRDYEKAYFCFVKGALDNHPISMYKIGDMYRNGYFVSKDENEAFQIYRECWNIIRGDKHYIKSCGADIYMRLAECYAKGTGTRQNLKKALKFYQRAERLFYDRLLEGDFMIKHNYKHCIQEQDKLRKVLQAEIPQWTGFEEDPSNIPADEEIRVAEPAPAPSEGPYTEDDPDEDYAVPDDEDGTNLPN